MNISHIAMRNFELKVSGKRYNKTIDVVLNAEYNGTGYTLSMKTTVARDYPSFTRKLKQELEFDVLCDDNRIDNGVKFGPFFVELLTQFDEIVKNELEDLDIDNLVTTILKPSSFVCNSGIKEEILKDIPILYPKLERKEGETYIEKFLYENMAYVFRYTPRCMGFIGTAVGKGSKLKFVIA